MQAHIHQKARLNMETSIMETILIPWWKPLIYLAAITLCVITIRISIKFDLNTWLKARKKSKELKHREKIIRNCQHIWTLYTHSPYSICERCRVLISTSILLIAMESLDPKLVILGYVPMMAIKPRQNRLITSDYIGAKK